MREKILSVYQSYAHKSDQISSRGLLPYCMGTNCSKDGRCQKARTTELVITARFLAEKRTGLRSTIPIISWRKNENNKVFRQLII